MNQEIEIVLASGVFARIRKPTIGEYIKTVVRSGGKTAEDQCIGLLSLAAVCVKLDGEYLSADEWINLPVADATSVIEHLGRLMRNQ